jgi:hypothetical protein
MGKLLLQGKFGIFEVFLKEVWADEIKRLL